MKIDVNVPACEHPDKVEYRVREYGEFVTGIGIAYIVDEHHGRCNCGCVEMSTPIGYFPSRHHAKGFALFMRDLTAIVKDMVEHFNGVIREANKKPPVQ